jgi:arginyl-tRNA synthetase
MSEAKSIEAIIATGVSQAVQALYGAELAPSAVNINATRKEFAGEYTVVTFPLTRIAKQKPEVIGQQIGEVLQREVGAIVDFNVVKGFLNLSIADEFWRDFLVGTYENAAFGKGAPKDEKVMVEFSSPNTNKPLHLGHIRNNLLGWSVAQILDAAGYEVVKVQIINDRGIAICKSMLAWERFGNGETPESAGMKSDHFVGKYYVLFEQKFQEEYRAWQQTDVAQGLYASRGESDQSEADFFKGYKNTYFNEVSELGAAAKEMLRQWEAGDEQTVALWRKMNEWVYAGFNATYARLGVSFDKLYYESDTYLLGKDIIEKGLADGTFYRRDDGSVWIDLTDAKLDHKILLRSDGTSVYMTQDLGTARLRYEDFGVDKMVYTVADEQNYHFQVLFEILKRLGEPYADGLHHLSYGMVDLPSGRMKSREGTVVDADDLMDEVIAEARQASAERDTTAGLSPAEQESIIEQIGLAALKYYIIRVSPHKRMIFNPAESVDLQGQTGPYIQNAYVRIQSVLRKAGTGAITHTDQYSTLAEAEKTIAHQLYGFPALIQQAAAEYDPSLVASYCYDLAKNYHQFYQQHSILSAESDAARDFRLVLSRAVANTLKLGMHLLGIEMPERM